MTNIYINYNDGDDGKHMVSLDVGRQWNEVLEWLKRFLVINITNSGVFNQGGDKEVIFGSICMRLIKEISKEYTTSIKPESLNQEDDDDEKADGVPSIGIIFDAGDSPSALMHLYDDDSAPEGHIKVYEFRTDNQIRCDICHDLFEEGYYHQVTVTQEVDSCDFESQDYHPVCQHCLKAIKDTIEERKRGYKTEHKDEQK